MSIITVQACTRRSDWRGGPIVRRVPLSRHNRSDHRTSSACSLSGGTGKVGEEVQDAHVRAFERSFRHVVRWTIAHGLLVRKLTDAGR